MSVKKAPLVLQHSWGHIDVEGLGGGKDFKLWPGGGRTWDWRETDTHHVPGIQRSDVEELTRRGCRTVILTRGRLRKLQTCPETLMYLRDHGIAVRVAETAEAIRIYNALAARGEAVGGLFHSTC